MATKTKSQVDRELDESLKETFPASDAPASNEADEAAVRPKDRRPPLFDKNLVNRLADKLGERLKSRRN